jgi:hypothetical protein
MTLEINPQCPETVIPTDPKAAAKYSIEPHGGAYALYAGRDNQHHGWNLARIVEASQHTRDLIVEALNAHAELRARSKP